MSLEKLREQIPEFGRDIKLNLETILSPEGVPGLKIEQSAGIALACAYAVRQLDLAEAIKLELNVSEETNEAAKGAASIMAMNNVYYRSMHLIADKEITRLPARLRLNIISKPGIPKADFELMSFAVSAIGGCGACLNSHIEEVKKHGITIEGIHSSLRIAAVVNAAKTVFSIAQ